ncbi:hypothetical protein [Helicobacter rodentium]|uniref:hypothetical protein n=1 Tax=Helicobacter rodentium TaxID=59617 RepID=UPI0012EC1CE3|nr:hypothetical protein [Helicobacter rodentium]
MRLPPRHCERRSLVAIYNIVLLYKDSIVKNYFMHDYRLLRLSLRLLLAMTEESPLRHCEIP